MRATRWGIRSLIPVTLGPVSGGNGNGALTALTAAPVRQQFERLRKHSHYGLLLWTVWVTVSFGRHRGYSATDPAPA
jgi:hypothetical protein